jgi:uncharacterized protein
MNRPMHFEILGDDPQSLSRFYGEVFGWQIATWEGPQGYWLATTGDDGTPGINGGLMHRHFTQAVINTISVASLAEAVGRIESAGGSRVNEAHEIPGVGMHVYCADPEGNLFGILEPTAPRS